MNLYDFTSLENIFLLWELEKDGNILSSGTVDQLCCPPHQSKEYHLDLDIPSECCFGCHLNLSFRLKEDTIWADRSYEIAFEQAELPVKRICINSDPCTEKITVSSSDEYYVIKGKDFIYRFNRFYGGFESIEKCGMELLKNRTKFGIWRPFGGTDGMIKSKWVMTEDSSWNKSENYDKVGIRVYSSAITENGNETVIYVKQSLSPLSKMPLIQMNTEYRIHPDGEIEVISFNHVRKDAAFLPRFGFELELNGNTENLEYYANGPEENYPDLCHNVRKGLFYSKIDEDYVKKAFPQEQGNHTGARFLSVYDDSGNGITFRCDGEKEFQFRATHHSIDDINRARHYCELKNKDTSFLRIDYKVSGIGAYSLQNKYKFLEKDFVFRFYMKPFTNYERRP